MLLYRPTLLLAVALLVRRGLPGLFAGAGLASVSGFASRELPGLCCYMLFYRPLRGCLVCMLRFCCMLFRFAIENLSGRYAISLICDVASRGPGNYLARVLLCLWTLLLVVGCSACVLLG